MMTEQMLYTIGHSNRTIDKFIELLKENRVDAIADVRSSPFSGMNPQYNREVLKQTLSSNGIAYVFLGKELGARRDEDSCYVDGVARYEKIAVTEAFRAGLDRIRLGVKSRRIAMMCAEKDPLTCHRTILICRYLKGHVSIAHIIEPGGLERHEDAEDRLMRLFGLNNRTLFESRDEVLAEAYEKQGNKIAYRSMASTAKGMDSE
jgi:uncharacterized protein (DUF488 family)